ncbi:SDR family oxidoreductase [Longimicrobium sp.]|uniref:SDR family oxidoreductase n=1 Tax=Longimicrobium sp. TaxID=2029185 RepID=UPI002CF29279|nr:SDR family oxidoreductase [Longimicrobium sp.]HSU14689.1 SDR family oxidoreductase [Longimicrobium sp.]
MAKNGAEAAGGPVAFISGGAGNLGRAVTRVFLEAGWRVSVALHHTDRKDALDELKSAYAGRVSTCMLDLTTERGADSAIRQTTQWGGRLDAVAHVMGAWHGGAKVGDTSLGVWEAMMSVNLTSGFLLANAAIPRMADGGGGSIVFVASRAAREQRAGNGAYAVSKAGLIVLAETIAEEYRDRGVRANAVLPGTIDTPANRRSMPDADASKWTPPEEIARVVLFLASPESAPVNGAAVPVYGRS